MVIITSMIFDLATFKLFKFIAITGMAFKFTSAATTHKNGQINVYNSTTCNPANFTLALNAGGVTDISCPVNQCVELSGQDRVALQIFNLKDQPETTCYFFNSSITSQCNSTYFAFQRAADGCQPIPPSLIDDIGNPMPMMMQCFTGTGAC